MAVITGTIGNDTGATALIGTNVADTIHDGGGGNDSLSGLGGNDILTVTGGVDNADGGAGDDLLLISWGDLTVDASTSWGPFSNSGGGFYGTFNGADGRSVSYNLIERFRIFTGSGNDALTTAGGNDSISSGAGNDAINVGTGNDTANGGLGDDVITANLSGAGAGSVWDLVANTYSNAAGYGSFTNFEAFGTITGTAFGDTFNSRLLAFNEAIYSGDGNDTFTTRMGDDFFNGGADSDRLVIDWSDAATNSWTSSGPFANSGGGYYGTYENADGRSVTYDSVEHITFLGGSGSDVIYTANGDDVFVMGDGDDQVHAGAGVNTIDGGWGFDRLSINFSAAASRINLDLTRTGAQLLAGPGSITGIEWANELIATAYNDIVITNDLAFNDRIFGGDGTDTVTLRNGLDFFDGQGGTNDRLIIDWRTSVADSWVSWGPFSNAEGGYYGTYLNADGREASFQRVEHFTFLGGSGGDAITAFGGNDVFTMGDGDDFANVGGGVNQVDGGNGIDRIGIDYSAHGSGITLDLTQTGAQLLAGPGSVAGIEWINTLTGSAYGDTIVTLDLVLNDYIVGGDGNDTVTFRNGNDYFNGQGGANDRLIVDWSSATGNSWMSYGPFGNSAGGYYGTMFSEAVGSTPSREAGFNEVEHFTFIGGTGNDAITAFAGDDVFTMGDGDDFANVGGGVNQVDGGNGTDRIGIDYSAHGSGISLDLTQAGAQLLSGPGSVTGIEWINSLTGTAHADTIVTLDADLDDYIVGGDGNDVVTYRGGSDYFNGQGGTGDRLIVDWSSSTSDSWMSYGPFGNSTGGYYGTFANGDGREAGFNEVEHFTFLGGSGNDAITAFAGDDVFIMGAGDDAANVGGGTNVVDGGAGIDSISITFAGSAAAFNLNLAASGAQLVAGPGSVTGIEWASSVTGSDYGDTLVTTDVDRDDSFVAGDGDDVMIVRNGSDWFNGGAGYDTLYIDWSSATGTSYIAWGPFNNSGGGFYGTYANTDGRQVGFDSIERIVFITGSGDDTVNGNSGNDELTGNGGTDIIYGYAGDDTLNGGEGNDTLDGGDGSDTAAYTGDPAGVSVDLANQTATDGWGDTDTLISIENASGSAHADTLLGNTADNVLSGRAGNDVLNGGHGNDTADYSADPAGITVNLAANSATDGWGNVDSLVSIENVTGSAHADSITGNSGANTLNGGGGNDTLNGGVGLDSVLGGDGDDVLIGGAGADTLNGGNGRDTADYSASAGAVTVNLIAASQLGGTALGDVLADIENVIGSAQADNISGDANDNGLFGGAGDDTLSGGNGADTLDGGDGLDQLSGGGGNDTFLVRGHEILSETSGIDTVVSHLASYTLLAGFENLTLAEGIGITGTGNAVANLMVGNSTANTLIGGGGNDTLEGGNGNDFLSGGLGTDVMRGGNGDDIYLVDNVGDVVDESTGSGAADEVRSSVNHTLASGVEILRMQGVAVSGTGNAGDNSLIGNGTGNLFDGADGADKLYGYGGADTLLGGAGADSLYGGGAIDQIYGGAGRDILRGDLGNDVFWFDDGDYSGITNAAADRIVDFGQGFDKIDLSLTDAVAGGADNAFSFIGTAAFGNVAGQLRFEQSLGVTLILGDTNGDGLADIAIALTGTINLLATDFVL